MIESMIVGFHTMKFKDMGTTGYSTLTPFAMADFEKFLPRGLVSDTNLYATLELDMRLFHKVQNDIPVTIGSVSDFVFNFAAYQIPRYGKIISVNNDHDMFAVVGCEYHDVAAKLNIWWAENGEAVGVVDLLNQLEECYVIGHGRLGMYAVVHRFLYLKRHRDMAVQKLIYNFDKIMTGVYRDDPHMVQSAYRYHDEYFVYRNCTHYFNDPELRII